MTTPIQTPVSALLVTGAGGRIGSALRRLWPDNRLGDLPILWQARRGLDIDWTIGDAPPPDLPQGLVALHLAGLTRGTAADLAQNVTVTRDVCAAALARRAFHVFAMSTAAVYAPAPYLLSEETEPAPVSDYGRSKLAAEHAAQQVLPPDSPTGLTLLRLGNLAGADALLGNARPDRPVVLDPIAGQSCGPERSYIGPRMLAFALAALIQRRLSGLELPRILNLAQPGAIAMADLLDARGQPWSFGPPRPAAIPRVLLDTSRLNALIPLPPATAQGLVQDLDSVTGWPA